MNNILLKHLVIKGITPHKRNNLQLNAILSSVLKTNKARLPTGGNIVEKFNDYISYTCSIYTGWMPKPRSSDIEAPPRKQRSITVSKSFINIDLLACSSQGAGYTDTRNYTHRD